MAMPERAVEERSSAPTRLAVPTLLSRSWPAVAAFSCLILAWEAYVRLSGIAPQTLPTPSHVLAQVWRNRHGLIENLVPTLLATLLGFSISVASAFILSVMVDFSHLLRRALFPVFIVSQTMPLVAIAPLVVLWFGFGLVPKILLVALVTFFPMLVALAEGYGATEKEIEELLVSMGASRWKRFLLGRLPSALPYFFAGLRISITYAVVGAIFAEYAGAAKGLGIYILTAKNNFRPDLVLAAVFVSSVLTLALFTATFLVQRLVAPWSIASGAKTR